MKRFGVALVATVVLGLMVAGPALAKYSPPQAGGSGTTITGSNWCPNSTVQIFVDGDLVGTATTASDGTFTFDLPSSVDTTVDHDITVTGLSADCATVKSVTFVLGASGSTAFTGANVSTGILILGSLILIGAGALVAGRRRKTTAE